MADLFSGISWLDVSFSLILLVIIFKGYRLGVGSQIIPLIWCFLLIFATFGYFSALASRLPSLLTPEWARAFSFFVILAAMYLVIKVAGRALKIEKIEGNISIIEKTGGIFMAAVRAFLIFGVLGTQLLLLPVESLRSSVTEFSKTGALFVAIDLGIYRWIAEKAGFMSPGDPEEITQYFAEAGGKDQKK